MATARPRPLPAQLTSFLGREEELVAVGKLLGDARLVTLTGPGGAGKTRLAIEAVSRQDGEHSFVDLAPLTDGADVAPAVLGALGLRDAGLRAPAAGVHPDPVDRIAAALAGRPVLLVLDNCEHVVADTAALAGRLLADCPWLRIVATSREPLGLTGEALCPVPGLAARLDDRFALLWRGSRTAQPRHRTLRALIAWSWELLDQTEQALARRLTVFAGGATLAAVERVCGASVDVLSSLVDKSLVEVSGERYRMLETVRAYGAEELHAAGEVERLRRAHAAYFLELAGTTDRELRGADQLAWLAVMDQERDNLHAVVRNASAAGDVGTALQLVSALAFYWWVRGLRGEAAILAAEVLAVAGDRPPSGWEEEHALCHLVAALGSPDDSWRAQQLRRAAAATFRLAHRPRQPFLFYLSSMVAGPPEGGADTVREMIAATERTLGFDPWTRALSPVGLAIVLAREGDLAAAEEHARTSLARFRELGERWGMVTALGALGEVVAMRGDTAAAVRCLGEALELAGELGSLVDFAELLRMRADVHHRAGDLDAAGRDYQQMLESAGRAGAPELVAAGRLGLALLAWQRGAPSRARRLAEKALAECPTGWFAADETRAEVLATLARLPPGD